MKIRTIDVKEIIAKLTLIKAVFVFVVLVIILFSPHFLINNAIIFSYFFSITLFLCAFLLLYLLSFQLLCSSEHLSNKEKYAAIGIWLVASAIFIVAFSILHSLAGTSGEVNYIYFSVVTFTTVGYGDLYPQSSFGHILCCLEAFCGLLCLGILVKLLTKVFELGKVQFSFILLSLFILMIFPAIAYSCLGVVNSHAESNNTSIDFFDALYFSAVTLTSLGYGDFYPTIKSQPIVIVQALSGYCLVGFSISVITEKYFSLHNADSEGIC